MQYCGGYSALWRDNISTVVGQNQHCGGLPSTSLEGVHICGGIPSVLWRKTTSTVEDVQNCWEHHQHCLGGHHQDCGGHHR